MDFINGHLEHVHCLISMRSGQTIDNIMMLIKGESSFWINKNKILPGKFEWQGDYYAASVSEKDLGAVRNYIKNQEKHHSVKSYDLEYQEFIKDNNIDIPMG
ncbi:MAG: transposase [Bacteroidales bacterium]|nr:transposase [Bacteroidales bacterium]